MARGHERSSLLNARDPNLDNQNTTDTGVAGLQKTNAPDQVQQSAGAVASQTKEAASQIKDQAKSTATGQLAVRKDQTAQGLNVVSSAVHDMSDRLRQNQQTASYANYADQAANQIQRLSGYLQNRDVGQIVQEAQDWARREPVIAIGGAFVLGLVAARFLKSSGIQTRSANVNRGGYSPGYRYNRQYYQTSPNTWNDPNYRDPGYGTGYRPSGQYWNEPNRSPGTDTSDATDTSESR
jgi:hypothetical protein